MDVKLKNIQETGRTETVHAMCVCVCRARNINCKQGEVPLELLTEVQIQRSVNRVV